MRLAYVPERFWVRFPGKLFFCLSALFVWHVSISGALQFSFRPISHSTVSWSSGYDFPLTNAISVCSGKVLGSIPRETIFCIFAM
ncbi:hypothetical protein VN97_g804 [Penicillium thymicola]|uniref:Uncharacterized protein n=1 Tax=Penicillium thymicola TaxID=293382 RepID=A0AAI9TS14_PENTH|nr:hypothetical protein VN97_g804 [Penicillium thymicola]